MFMWYTYFAIVYISLAQVVQLSSISGTENNLILLEYGESDKDSFEDVMSNFNLLHTTGYDVAIMRSMIKKLTKKKKYIFGYHQETLKIQIWWFY